MNRPTVWTRVRQIWISAGLIFTAVFVGWSVVAYRPSDDAKAAIASDPDVVVEHDAGVWTFRAARTSPGAADDQPAHDDAMPALVFFPGSLVDPVAYAPLARAVARAGYPAYIIELPRRGAFGGATSAALHSRLSRVLADVHTARPEVARRWVVAGHSLGAVVASNVAAATPDGLHGVVLIGSSHPRDVDLSALSLPVTKIVGTRDGLASKAEVDANRGKVPMSTRWEWIEGGNHSQFGWYGFQPGDRPATIDAETQRAAMIRAVLDMMVTVTHDGVSAPSA